MCRLCVVVSCSFFVWFIKNVDAVLFCVTPLGFLDQESSDCEMGKKKEYVKGAVRKAKTKFKELRGDNLLPGETHGLVWVPGKGIERSNFMGPGTDVFARLARGDKGKTAIDEISRLHDIEYTLANNTSRSDEEQLQMARAADDRMIASGWDAFKSGRASAFDTIQGAGLIRAKRLLEDWKILNPRKFLSPRVFKYKMDAEGRDATEYEMLLRARSAMIKSGPTADPHEESRLAQGTSLFAEHTA